jgi:hypothetical protein
MFAWMALRGKTRPFSIPRLLKACYYGTLALVWHTPHTVRNGPGIRFRGMRQFSSVSGFADRAPRSQF